MDWHNWVPAEYAYRRAGGRNRYNSIRQMRADMRVAKVSELLQKYPHERGLQARIAEELGVSEATISRDVGRLMHSGHRCPACQSYIPGNIERRRLTSRRAKPVRVVHVGESPCNA